MLGCPSFVVFTFGSLTSVCGCPSRAFPTLADVGKDRAELDARACERGKAEKALADTVLRRDWAGCTR
jgi:hypothetical protein